MGKLIEYLRLIPEGIKNADKVLEGVANQVMAYYGHLPEDEMQEIARRKLICKSCPFFSVNAVNDPNLNYKTDRTDDHCTQCGCPIETRIASLSANCGIENYNARNPHNPLPLKWSAYKNQNQQ